MSIMSDPSRFIRETNQLGANKSVEADGRTWCHHDPVFPGLLYRTKQESIPRVACLNTPIPHLHQDDSPRKTPWKPQPGKAASHERRPS